MHVARFIKPFHSVDASFGLICMDGAKGKVGSFSSTMRRSKSTHCRLLPSPLRYCSASYAKPHWSAMRRFKADPHKQDSAPFLGDIQWFHFPAMQITYTHFTYSLIGGSNHTSCLCLSNAGPRLVRSYDEDSVFPHCFVGACACVRTHYFNGKCE